ncbi:hypothetical protein [Bacteroides sp.]|uniref:hypothetical protein n=1 Tax=Bacteroides sp. TaxID=29523 RepID=UPI003AB8054A
MTTPIPCIDCIRIMSASYPNRICTVLAPYILHSEVPLTEGTTELVRSKYGADTV